MTDYTVLTKRLGVDGTLNVAQAELARVTAERDAAVARWQQIETAPFGRLVLLTVEYGGERRVFVAEEDSNGWLFTTDWTGWSRLRHWKPTHWMPLPPPAK